MAIILVMLFHFYNLLEVGWIGVQLFFVLSGYLITTILLEEKSHNFSFYLKRFYWRRSLRIFPLYYTYLALVSIVYLIAHIPQNFLQAIPYLLTYTYNYLPLIIGLKFDAFFPHFWSLSVEEQFYLFWPLLIFVFSSRGLRIMIVLIIIFSPIFRLIMGLQLTDDFTSSIEIGEIIYRLLPSQLDAFAYGALIPIFKLNKLQWNWSVILITVLVFFITVGVSNFNSVGFSSMHSFSSLGYPIGSLHNQAHVWSYMLINTLCMVIILWVLSCKRTHPVLQFFSTKAMVSIGKISYGMYVYHWVIIFTIRKYVKLDGAIELTAGFILYAALTYVISWLSFEYLEKFFLQWKNKRFNKPANSH